MTDGRYLDCSYLNANPSWHIEDSPWKAEQVLSMLARHPEVATATVAEVGCGAGEILRVLRDRMPADTEFHGYEISPQAYALAQTREGERLQFHLADITSRDVHFDLTLVMDVLEHVEDPFGFMRAIRDRSGHVLLHIPLDMFALSAMRPHALAESRRTFGHIQYFLKDTALALLSDVELTIVDSRYTWSGGKFDGRPKDRFLYLARKVVHCLVPGLEVRLLGGYSLLVLAKAA